MVAKNLLDDVLALPVDQKLEFFERLRVDLMNDPTLNPLSEADRQLLDERLKEYEEDPTEGSPWEVVEARLLGLLKDGR
jgi:putative addiction module component (TIGR02574 family)